MKANVYGIILFALAIVAVVYVLDPSTRTTVDDVGRGVWQQTSLLQHSDEEVSNKDNVVIPKSLICPQLLLKTDHRPMHRVHAFFDSRINRIKRFLSHSYPGKKITVGHYGGIDSNMDAHFVKVDGRTFSA